MSEQPRQTPPTPDQQGADGPTPEELLQAQIDEANHQFDDLLDRGGDINNKWENDGEKIQALSDKLGKLSVGSQLHAANRYDAAEVANSRVTTDPHTHSTGAARAPEMRRTRHTDGKLIDFLADRRSIANPDYDPKTKGSEKVIPRQPGQEQPRSGDLSRMQQWQQKRAHRRLARQRDRQAESRSVERALTGGIGLGVESKYGSKLARRAAKKDIDERYKRGEITAAEREQETARVSYTVTETTTAKDVRRATHRERAGALYTAAAAESPIRGNYHGHRVGVTEKKLDAAEAKRAKRMNQIHEVALEANEVWDRRKDLEREQRRLSGDPDWDTEPTGPIITPSERQDNTTSQEQGNQPAAELTEAAEPAEQAPTHQEQMREIQTLVLKEIASMKRVEKNNWRDGNIPAAVEERIEERAKHTVMLGLLGGRDVADMDDVEQAIDFYNAEAANLPERTAEELAEIDAALISANRPEQIRAEYGDYFNPEWLVEEIAPAIAAQIAAEKQFARDRNNGRLLPSEANRINEETPRAVINSYLPENTPPDVATEIYTEFQEVLSRYRGGGQRRQDGSRQQGRRQDAPREQQPQPGGGRPAGEQYQGLTDAQVEAIKNDQRYAHLFDLDKLRKLHQDIQDAVRPQFEEYMKEHGEDVYRAALTKLNAQRIRDGESPLRELPEMNKKAAERERRQTFVRPVSDELTAQYAGEGTPPEVLEAIKQVRLADDKARKASQSSQPQNPTN